MSAGIRAHRDGHLAKALELYEQRLQEAPDCLDSWMNLGAACAQQGRVLEASNAFVHAAALGSADGRVFRDIGLGLRTVGRLADAARALERSVEYEPELVGSWLHLARIRLETAARPLAIAAAERAVELHPENASAQFVLARCLFDEAAPRRTLQALERAQRCQPSHPESGVFQLLIEARRESQHSKTHSDERFRQDLTPLVSAHPRLRHLADAASYIRLEMGRAQLFSSARDTLAFALSQAPPHGTVVELGVFHGVSLRWLAESRPGAVHGFDSFAGLPSAWGSVPTGTFTTRGNIPNVVGARIWTGSFEEQLPRFAEECDGPIALLHVDSDLYESARCGLAHLGRHLVAGSVLVFDEYLGHNSWRQDEFRAFQEAVVDCAWNYEYLAANPFTGQVVVQLQDAPQSGALGVK